jgi:hypothetical protein
LKLEEGRASRSDGLVSLDDRRQRLGPAVSGRKPEIDPIFDRRRQLDMGAGGDEHYVRGCRFSCGNRQERSVSQETEFPKCTK